MGYLRKRGRYNVGESQRLWNGGVGYWLSPGRREVKGVYSGTLIFRSQIEGAQFEQIAFTSEEPSIRKVEIVSNSDVKVTITFHVAGVMFPSDATPMARA